MMTGRFGEGLGRVWGGFGEGLGGILRRFWEGLGWLGRLSQTLDAFLAKILRQRMFLSGVCLPWIAKNIFLSGVRLPWIANSVWKFSDRKSFCLAFACPGLPVPYTNFKIPFGFFGRRPSTNPQTERKSLPVFLRTVNSFSRPGGMRGAITMKKT